MKQNQTPFSMEDALRLASTDAGRQLLRLLQGTGAQDAQAAKNAVQKGDMEQAKQQLSHLLDSPQVQQLLKELEKSHG